MSVYGDEDGKRKAAPLESAFHSRVDAAKGHIATVVADGDYAVDWNGKTCRPVARVHVRQADQITMTTADPGSDFHPQIPT